MAKEWGVPPWQIEADAPAIWIERWLALKDFQNKEQELQKRRAAVNSAATGNRRSTSL